MKVGEVCRRNVVTSVEGASLAQIARLMRGAHVGSVVIVQAPGSRVPIGIVTDRDIVVEAVAGGLDARTLSAGDIMNRDPVTAAESDDASWSLKVMRDRGIRRLPVIDGAGELVGIVALDDLLETALAALSDVVQAIGTGRLMESARRKALA